MRGRPVKFLILIVPLMVFLLCGCSADDTSTTTHDIVPTETSKSPDTILIPSPTTTSQPENQLTFGNFNLAVHLNSTKENTPAYIHVMTDTESPLPDRWEYYTPFAPERQEKTIEDVDFSKHFLLFASMGFRGWTGPQITIKQIRQDGDIIYVQAKFYPGGPTGQPMHSEPTHLVRVSKENMIQTGEITFVLLDEEGNERARNTCVIPPNETSDTPMTSMPPSVELDLSGKQLKSIPQLPANLTKLDLSENHISDISPLASLTNLKELNLSYNSINDLAPLSELQNLTSLTMESIVISDFSVLPSLSNLKELDIANNHVNNISFLSKFTGLTKLNLNKNDITNISPLTSLTDLIELGLWANDNLSDISPLSSLSNLVILDLRTNSISDVHALSSLLNLEELNLSLNPITDISALSPLHNLKTLTIKYTQLSDISPLSSLINLTKLDLSSNQISDISFLAKLINLTTLDLGNNRTISDISFLSELTQLTNVNLSNNIISDISALSSLHNLIELFLCHNQISDVSPLLQNSGFDTGVRIDLTDNPLSDDSFTKYIPQLEQRGVHITTLQPPTVTN